MNLAGGCFLLLFLLLLLLLLLLLFLLLLFLWLLLFFSFYHLEIKNLRMIRMSVFQKMLQKLQWKNNTFRKFHQHNHLNNNSSAFTAFCREVF